jgi:hypothetical protein
MKRFWLHSVQIGMIVVLLAGLFAVSLGSAQAQSKPSFQVQAVVMDSLVYVKALNFPASATFSVSMGKAGMQGLDGPVIAHFDTGSPAGTGYYIFEIPVILRGSAQIDLRAESGGGTVVLLTFNNAFQSMTSGGGAVGGSAPLSPILSVLSVAQGGKVTVQISNLPANLTFGAFMGPVGSQGVRGQSVANFDTGPGGKTVKTFSIPVSLAASAQIDLRIEATGGYFAYVTFSNQSFGYTPRGVGGVSAITVVKMVKDSLVTATLKNLPANVTISVFIGAAGSQGLGGSQVANFETGAGGASTHLFEFPVSLRGSANVDLRLQAPGYAVYATIANTNLP